MAHPISIYINTYGTSKVKLSDAEISLEINKVFNLTPAEITNRFKLLDPIYRPTASYGHMGRKPQVITSKLNNKKIELFPWEKLNYVERIKTHFNI